MATSAPTLTFDPIQAPSLSLQEVVGHLDHAAAMYLDVDGSLNLGDADRAREAMSIATGELVPCWVGLASLLPTAALNADAADASMSLAIDLPEPAPWTAGPLPSRFQAPPNLAAYEPALPWLVRELRSLVSIAENHIKYGRLDMVGEAFEVLVRHHQAAQVSTARLPTAPELTVLAERRRGEKPLRAATVPAPLSPLPIPASADLGDPMRVYARDLFAMLVAHRPKEGGFQPLTAGERRVWQELDVAVPDLVAGAMSELHAGHVLSRWTSMEVEDLGRTIRAGRMRRGRVAPVDGP